MKRISLVISLLTLISCADRQSGIQAGGQVGKGSVSDQLALAEPGQLVIVDDVNIPVPNANVLIGKSPGDPFEGNSLTTDASGQIHLPPNFKSELPMTVSAPGYITQTFLRFTPNMTIAQLHKKEGSSKIEVKGTATNFNDVVDGDGKIDFGLVIPSLTKSQLLAFDLSAVLSPENDKINIAGKDVQLPSNIALPEQHERYDIIIPVDLNKPDYRNYVREPGTYHFSAVRGWFPMKQVVDGIRGGKSIFDVINFFQFTTIGSRNVTATKNIEGQDINVSQNPMDKAYAAHAPQFDNSKVMLSLALAEENGRLAVTDLKRLTSNQTVQLKGTSSLGGRRMLSALMNSANTEPDPGPITANNLLSIDHTVSLFSLVATLAGGVPNFRQLSFTFQNEGDGAPNFMPLVTAPTITNDVVQLQMPQLPAGLRVLGTYLVYSDILAGSTGSVKSEIRTRLWEIWHDGWVNTITLPDVKFDKVAGHTNRWEVMFFATSNASDEGTVDGSALNINSITHVSRNAVNVK